MTRKQNKAAVTLGKLGGLARAKKLSKKALSEQGRKAAIARWAKVKRKSKP
jgi:hypothetical protein